MTGNRPSNLQEKLEIAIAHGQRPECDPATERSHMTGGSGMVLVLLQDGILTMLTGFGA